MSADRLFIFIAALSLFLQGFRKGCRMLKVVPVFIHPSEEGNVRDGEICCVWITHTLLEVDRVEFSEKY